MLYGNLSLKCIGKWIQFEFEFRYGITNRCRSKNSTQISNNTLSEIKSIHLKLIIEYCSCSGVSESVPCSLPHPNINRRHTSLNVYMKMCTRRWTFCYAHGGMRAVRVEYFKTTQANGYIIIRFGFCFYSEFCYFSVACDHVSLWEWIEHRVHWKKKNWWWISMAIKMLSHRHTTRLLNALSIVFRLKFSSEAWSCVGALSIWNMQMVCIEAFDCIKIFHHGISIRFEI